MNTTVDRVSPEVAVVGLEGELDASNFQDLVTVGQQLYADGARRLVLDLSALSYMASSGIVALHSLSLVFRGQPALDPESGWQAIHSLGADVSGGAVDAVRIVAPQTAVQRVLDRTGLSRMLPVFPDRDAAVAG